MPLLGPERAVPQWYAVHARSNFERGLAQAVGPKAWITFCQQCRSNIAGKTARKPSTCRCFRVISSFASQLNIVCGFCIPTERPGYSVTVVASSRFQHGSRIGPVARGLRPPLLRPPLLSRMGPGTRQERPVERCRGCDDSVQESKSPGAVGESSGSIDRGTDRYCGCGSSLNQRTQPGHMERNNLTTA